MKVLKIKLTLTEELLGTASGNKDVHREFIASKSPDPTTIEDEVASIGVEGVMDKSKTLFPRHEGKPFLYDYQIKGFFKDAISSLARVPGSLSNKIKARHKVIDQTVFPFPRKIMLNLPGPITDCTRPLRAETAQGPRVALATSEAAPAGTVLEFEIKLLDEGTEKVIRELLDYGALRGLGQWRNSGKGRFSWEEVTGDHKAKK